MASIHAEPDDCLVILSKDDRNPLLRLPVDGAREMRADLVNAADLVDKAMKESGKLIVPKLATEVWDAKIGYFDGGVAILFNNPGTRVPLPPDVARALADRIEAAVNAAVTGLSVKFAGQTPQKSFGLRNVTS